MMGWSPSRLLAAALGPIFRALTPTATEPLTGQGILNQSDLGTTPVLVLAGKAEGKALRCKLVVITDAVNVAYATVERDAAAPTITAAADGSATDGSLITGGDGAVEFFTISDACDLYIVASAAATVVQLTVFES